MPVDIRAKVVVSERLQEAMRRSPQIVGDELAQGMQEIRVIKNQVEVNIGTGGTGTGRLIKGVRARVFRDTQTANVRGVVDVKARNKGANYAPMQEHGGTIKAKPGKWLLIPLGERVIITHIERRGQMRELKRPRVETLVERFARVKQVTIPAKWYFRKGLRSGLPHVERSLEQAGERGVKRVFEGG